MLAGHFAATSTALLRERVADPQTTHAADDCLDACEAVAHLLVDAFAGKPKAELRPRAGRRDSWQAQYGGERYPGSLDRPPGQAGSA